MLAVAEGFDEAPIAALLRPDLDPAALLCDPDAVPDLPLRVRRRLRTGGLAAAAQALRADAARHGLCVLTRADERFPDRLRALPAPPLVLFVRGDPEVLTRDPAAAVVGSRTPTPYGLECATQLGAALARAGVVLWSGLARGIDGLAHRASVAARTPGVAVLAGGLDRIYPPEHAPLADDLLTHGGCLVSELPPGRTARRGHFVRRNRLLAAGPPAVLVVEAALVSGALHTARFAADCATDVYAVPGPIGSERSQGCHRLLAEGARVVESAELLLRDLGVAGQGSAADAHALVGSADAEAVLAVLARGARPSDLLQREAGLDRGAFLHAVLALTERGLVQRLPGDLLAATSRR